MHALHIAAHGDAPVRASRNRRTGSPRRKLAGVLAALALVGTVVPFMGASNVSAAATAPAHSTTLNPGGFPLWFQDANGIRVEPCLDPALTNCLAPLANPGVYDPTLPLSFPSNYPDEMFYSAVDSEPILLDDCPAPAGAAAANPGLTVHLAIEGAFINGDPAAGDQMVFGRIRPRIPTGAGMCANTWYTLRTPYGPLTVLTDANAEVVGGAAAAVTADIGCVPATAKPCNFDDTLNAPALQQGLLRQVTGAAPGYLGDGSFGPVTGSASGFNQLDVVKWPEGVSPSGAGYGIDCTDANCAVIGSTVNFAVLAKLAGPLSTSASTVDFGGQVVGSTSATRTVTVTNVGSGALGLDPSTIDRIAITGDGFALATTSCSIGALTDPLPATAMDRDATCSVDVSFSPSAIGVANAILEVYANGSTVPFTVALTGTGINDGDAPAISISPSTSVDFGAVRLLTAGAIHTLTVTNTGTAPLLVEPSIVASADSAAFLLAGNSCTGGYVAAGANCTIGLRFIPTRTGVFAELLSVSTNAGAPEVLALNAVATGGIAAVSSTLDPVNTFPDWYQDERGVRVGKCDDPFNPLCIAAPVTGDVSFPTNYPDEWFYYVASSAPMDVSDPVCDLEPGGLAVEGATEAAFLGPIAPNEGITFGRLRIVSRGGLCPSTEYLFTHPYGRTILSTDAAGDIKPAAGTTDLGCLSAPCDYSLALSAAISEGYLEQTVHPAGWLGDPVTPSTVTGAPYIDPATGVPANYFNVQRVDTIGEPDSIFASTDQFGVSGRLVGPMVASPGALDFGGVEAGLVSATVNQSTTFTNNGIAAVTLAATPVTIDGLNSADFTVTTSTCAAGLVLQPTQSCSVSLNYLPLATGVRSAALTLHHSGRNNPLAVVLSGIGNAPAGFAAISSSPASVSFTDLKIGRASESVTLSISNIGGSSPLLVDTPTIPAGQPFSIVSNDCPTVQPGVQPGGTCAIKVRFVPTTTGSFATTLSLPSNAVTGTLSVALSGKATNVSPAQSATSTVAGFPSWFQDGNGVRVEQCLQNDGLCVLLPDATFNPALPVVFPSNYPAEAFYSIADSDLLTYGPQQCAGGTASAGGFAQLRVATEAAFTTPAPAAGAQTFFNRIRVTAGGLCPNTTYTFTHPYGTTNLTTDGAGDIRPKDGTFDNTNMTGSAPVSPALLRWDPNSGAAAPTGYLGDPRVLHKVVGSQFRLSPSGEPVNYFGVATQAGAPIGTTDLFALAGRMAGPVVSNVEVKDFGVVEVAKSSTTQSFTITNIGAASVSALTTTLSGANAALFTITANTCAVANLTLALDRSCTIQVQFRPTVAAGTGAKVATLTVGHNGLRSPVTIALSGFANAALTPALTVTPTTLAFGNVVSNTSSATSTVPIRNSGTGPLRLGALAISGTNANQYVIVGTTCPTATSLNAGVSCTVSVQFRPTSSGAKAGTISVIATDSSTVQGHVAAVMAPVNVSLTGTGAAGIISASPATLAISGRLGAVATSRITLTNTGTAPFSLVGSPAITFTAVSANTPLPRFSAAQTGCNAVAVGRSCTVTVSFAAPAAGVVGTVYSVDMAILSDASNSRVVVRVNGTIAR